MSQLNVGKKRPLCRWNKNENVHADRTRQVSEEYIWLFHTQEFPLFGSAHVRVVPPFNICGILVLQCAELDHVH